MAGVTDVTEIDALDHALSENVRAHPFVTTTFLALHTADPTESGTVGELAAGVNGYDRKAINFAASSGGVAVSSDEQTDDNITADWGLINFISIHTLATAGVALFKGPMTTDRAMAVGDTITFAIGDLDITFA